MCLAARCRHIHRSPHLYLAHFFLLLKSPPFNESPPVRTAEYSSAIPRELLVCGVQVSWKTLLLHLCLEKVKVKGQVKGGGGGGGSRTRRLRKVMLCVTSLSHCAAAWACQSLSPPARLHHLNFSSIFISSWQESRNSLCQAILESLCN